MAPPSDTSQPRLAAGCHWGGDQEPTERIASSCFPKARSNCKAPAWQILELCDGQRTFGEIIEELQKQFGADPEKIRDDITQFLEQLQTKRIVDY